MEPRIIAERKGMAFERTKAALENLKQNYGFDQLAIDEMRSAMAMRNDPLLTDLRHLEMIADLAEAVLKLAKEKELAGAAGTQSIVPQQSIVSPRRKGQ
jgi:hypothetical protein